MIRNLDLVADQRAISTKDVDFRPKAFTDLWTLRKTNDSNLLQRSKARRIKE